METVAANVERLIDWNRSMAVALERAEKGSEVEDQYFLEKLSKSAGVLGYVLAPPPKPKKPTPDINDTICPMCKCADITLGVFESIDDDAVLPFTCNGCGYAGGLWYRCYRITDKDGRQIVPPESEMSRP